MDPTQDPQHAQLALWALIAVVPVLLAVVGWSLRNSLRDVKVGITAIAADLRQLAATVGHQQTSLASGNEKFRQIERRLDGVEERERSRCNECRYTAEG